MNGIKNILLDLYFHDYYFGYDFTLSNNKSKFWP